MDGTETELRRLKFRRAIVNTTMETWSLPGRNKLLP
jgi:hypothetical protein